MEDLPCGYTKLLDPFRRLLLVRAWCPDRMLHMAEVYVRHSLGSEFIDAPLLDLEVLLLVNFALCFFLLFTLFGSSAFDCLYGTNHRSFYWNLFFKMFFFFPQSVLAESQPRLPLICILTTCSDPSLKIETLAKQKEMELQSLSMGQVPPPLVPSSFWNKLELAFFTFSLCPLCWH